MLLLQGQTHMFKPKTKAASDATGQILCFKQILFEINKSANTAL